MGSAWTRLMGSATSAEDLDDIAQELQKLQAEEASRLQSLRKADGDTVPARRQYVGKHRSQPVQPEKGERKGAAKGDSCASAGPPQDGKAEPEKGRKPSKSRARRAKKKQRMTRMPKKSLKKATNMEMDSQSLKKARKTLLVMVQPQDHQQLQPEKGFLQGSA